MTGEVSRQISPVTGPIFTLAQLALSLRGHMLFTDRSVLTMLHGIVLGGGALLIMAAALYALTTLPAGRGSPIDDRQARLLSRLLTLNAVLLWLTVLGGTYLVFPSYRATPPEGVADLTAYPSVAPRARTTALTGVG